LYKRPKLITEDNIFNPNSSEPYWENLNLDFSKYSHTGVIDDPIFASAELGGMQISNLLVRITNGFICCQILVILGTNFTYNKKDDTVVELIRKRYKVR
jgi:hypothetical protein